MDFARKGEVKKNMSGVRKVDDEVVFFFCVFKKEQSDHTNELSDSKLYHISPIFASIFEHQYEK